MLTAQPLKEGSYFFESTEGGGGFIPPPPLKPRRGPYSFSYVVILYNYV